MKTDIEIAQEAKLQPITEVAKKLDLKDDDLEQVTVNAVAEDSSAIVTIY